nr:hypothetical protein [Escherichia coli]
GKPPEWWEKQKGSRGIRRGQWYRLVFQFPIREPDPYYVTPEYLQFVLERFEITDIVIKPDTSGLYEELLMDQLLDR